MAQVEAPLQTNTQEKQEPGSGIVPKGAKTRDFYRTNNIPERFDNPGGCYSPGNLLFSCTTKVEPDPPRQPDPYEWFDGYDRKPEHPMYRTSANEYGSRPPTVHTMPTTFRARSQEFSQDLGKCGMYRNYSLNTALDQSKV